MKEDIHFYITKQIRNAFIFAKYIMLANTDVERTERT